MNALFWKHIPQFVLEKNAQNTHNCHNQTTRQDIGRSQSSGQLIYSLHGQANRPYPGECFTDTGCVFLDNTSPPHPGLP